MQTKQLRSCKKITQDAKVQKMENKMSSGLPLPLGATKRQGGFNFAIYSDTQIFELVIAPLSNSNEEIHIPLSPEKNRTGSIWHIFYPTSDTELYYAYMVDLAGKKLM